MKKSIILMLFMCMFIFTPMVEAECKYGFPSPPLPTNGTWKKDVTQYLYTSSDSCYSENAKVYFDSGSYLPTGRYYIYGYLYEEDDKNSDDLVKSYKGYSNGYNLISWEILGTHMTGTIDTPGDQRCELYMKYRVEVDGGTPYDILEPDLFRYTLCI